MKLVREPSKIVGVRVGEFSVNMITGGGLKAKYVLLRDPEGDHEGINAGSYTKEADFSEDTMEALQRLIVCMENDVVPELFEVKRKLPEDLKPSPSAEEKDDEDRLDFPQIPTLGVDGKSTPQI